MAMHTLFSLSLSLSLSLSALPKEIHCVRKEGEDRHAGSWSRCDVVVQEEGALSGQKLRSKSLIIIRLLLSQAKSRE